MPLKSKATRYIEAEEAPDLGLSQADEADIISAFGALCKRDVPGYDDEPVLARGDVRRAMVALDVAPKSESLPQVLDTLDPENTGYVPFAPFREFCAFALSVRDEELANEDEPQAHVKSSDVEQAYRMFTRGKNGPITVAGLRKIANDLNIEISDSELRDMIFEATGDHKAKTVSRADFVGVMKRAGAFR